MLKNSPSICYIFFAVDDVIVTSVNTQTSMMGYFLFSHKDLIKYLSSVLIPIIDVYVLTGATITSSTANNVQQTDDYF